MFNLYARQGLKTITGIIDRKNKEAEAEEAAKEIARQECTVEFKALVIKLSELGVYAWDIEKMVCQTIVDHRGLSDES